MENVMNQENSFNYKYSAVENRVIQEIRKNIYQQLKVRWMNYSV